LRKGSALSGQCKFAGQSADPRRPIELFARWRQRSSCWAGCQIGVHREAWGAPAHIAKMIDEEVVDLAMILRLIPLVGVESCRPVPRPRKPRKRSDGQIGGGNIGSNVSSFWRRSRCWRMRFQCRLYARRPKLGTPLPRPRDGQPALICKPHSSQDLAGPTTKKTGGAC